jgi:glutathione peroxidase
MRLGIVVALALAAACGAKPEPTASSTKSEPAKADTVKSADSAQPGRADFSPNDVVLDHEVQTLDGKSTSLASYRGKALLVVNTASQCGYTPQYAGLQQLYAEYRGKGLEVLAFPSDDFGGQEPGTNEEIRSFVDDKFAVEFPMFDKVHAKGPEIAPLYKTLSEQTGDGIKGEIEWNFTKFVVDPKGRVVARFAPDVDPKDPRVIAAIEGALPKG